MSLKAMEYKNHRTSKTQGCGVQKSQNFQNTKLS